MLVVLPLVFPVWHLGQQYQYHLKPARNANFGALSLLNYKLKDLALAI
jgi:hypothetical protein